MQPVTSEPIPIAPIDTDMVGSGDFSQRLLLICHAEEMAAQGGLTVSDAGLTAHGWRQTDLLADWLKSRYEIIVDEVPAGRVLQTPEKGTTTDSSVQAGASS